jgi:hypothetical protein
MTTRGATNADRQAAHRKRRQQEGLVQVLVWVHTSNKQKIKEVAKQMETPG